MNKSTIVFAALALLAASCTKTELVTGDAQSAQRGIGFSAYTAKPTKAAQKDVTTGDFNSFQVSAIGNGAVYFDDVTFMWKNDSNVWESDPLYFWPAYALNFCAYNTPAKGTFTRTITKDAQTLKFKPSTTLSEQEDLVAAYAGSKSESDATSPNHSLALTFKHYLTQVVVNAKCSNAGYTVVVDSVKITNLAGEGTYSFSTEKMVATTGLANSTSSTDYGSKFNSKTLSSSATEVMSDAGTGKWYLVPQTVASWKRNPTESAESATNEMKNASNGTYLALKVKITTSGGSAVYPYSGTESAWMAVPVPEALKFEQGKKYNVTVDFFSSTGNGAGYVDPEKPGELDGVSSTDDSGKKIIGGAIKFDAKVSEWGNAVDITISL